MAELEPMASPLAPKSPRLLKAYGLESVDWFDPETIRSGVAGNSQADRMLPRYVAVDTDRGRSYLFSSD